MEGSVTEVQSFLPSMNLNSEDVSKRIDCEEKEEGFVSTEKVEKVKEENLGGEHTGKDCAAEDEAKGNGGGGLINNLISTLITPLSPRTRKDESANGVFKLEEGADVDGGDHGERGGVENIGEGGLISNLVSNFFHQFEGESVVENEKDKEEEEIMIDEKIKRVKTENGANSGSGGIIHNIVSHLPASISDDTAPTADEATILINSLVRD